MDLNKRTRWFQWILYEDMEGCELLRSRAIVLGAEVYRHGGLRPHYHCLIRWKRPITVRSLLLLLGNPATPDFGPVSNPDAVRRYMKAGGVRVWN